MLEQGEHILCAVSGGADSMAMLHMLGDIAKMREIKISCAHFNHKIRDEAERDACFVQDYCRENNIPFYLGCGAVPEFASEHKMGLEEAARLLRYDFLQKIASEQNCNKIATAHNARDNAETVLMNFCRGSALRGVCGINPKRDNIIRPIICLDRWQIEQYLADENIPNITDESNFCLDYSRNKLRHGAIEKLGEYSNDFAEKMLKASLTLREDEDYLNQIASGYIPEDGILSAKILAELPEPISRRVIVQMADSISRRHIDMVLALARSEKPHGSLSLPKIKLIREYDKMYFTGIESSAICDVVIEPGTKTCVGKYTISCETGVFDDKKHKKWLFLCFKTAKVCGKIYVSSKKTGDTLSIAERNITKSLKKLYSEAKIPPSERETVPVFRDDKGVLGVYGFGVDRRVKADVGDEVVVVEIHQS